MPSAVRALASPPDLRLSVVRLAMLVALLLVCAPCTGAAQGEARVAGRVADDTGAPLPGASVELIAAGGRPRVTATDADGRYAFEDVARGTYTIAVALVNFGSAVHRGVVVDGREVRRDAVLQLSMSADVTVVARRGFTNLADVDDPAQSLVGIAQSASQGAITARQLDVRPIMRQGEVLETVPGVIVTQHSGEGKANQYFLRGFNLDHGSDFAVSVAGAPVNMPTHAHSQGYADVNFLIPEIVAGVQFSKGPYFADQGDFATAGSATITYATSLERPFLALERGAYGFSRGLLALSPKVGRGTLLAAVELSQNNGPWTVPDAYDKTNAVLRYSRGDSVNGLALTYAGYRGEWNATEASPQRAIDDGLIDRFGTIDPTDTGATGRHSVALEWQRGRSRAFTKVTAYALRYTLDLVSNFTFYLDDPVHGDQQQQIDRRWVLGGRASHRWTASLLGRPSEHTIGVQVRADRIGEVSLHHTESGARLETRASSRALVGAGGIYAQTQTSWTPWLRTTLGLRADGLGARVHALDAANSGTTRAALASPKLSVALGPWRRTEIYANAGSGFHSNNALGTTLTRDASGLPAERVTPLVRATGIEAGVRTIVVPRLQTTVSVWRLGLDSELVYNGDLGATEPGPASRRWGVEIANYYRPVSWLVLDADVSLSEARFASGESAGLRVPEAVGTVVSAGIGVEGVHRTFAGVRLRYFGARSLVEDDSVRSRPTTLVNLLGGYQVSRRLKVTLDAFNLLDAEHNDIDYYFRSRLPGEPLAGVDDHHVHPVVPRALRVATTVAF